MIIVLTIVKKTAMFFIPLNPLAGVETNVYCFTGVLVCWFANCVAVVWLVCFDDIYLVAGVTSYMLARSSVRHLLPATLPLYKFAVPPDYRRKQESNTL